MSLETTSGAHRNVDTSAQHFAVPDGGALAPSPDTTSSIQALRSSVRLPQTRAGRFTTASVAAVVALSPTACSVEVSAAGPMPGGEPTTATITVDTLPTTISIDGTITIDTTTLPEELPLAVAQQLDTVVAVREQRSVEEIDVDGNVQSTGFEEGIVGTGVKVSDTLALTAAHVVVSPGTSCGDYDVLGHDTETGLEAEAQVIGSTEVYAPTYTVEDTGTDIALLETPPDTLYTDIDAAEVRENPLAVGEHVYFVNYQPDGEGNARSPHDPNPTYAAPAIYGGVVVDTDDPLIPVAAGLKSYGVVPDMYGRRGSSGGGVYDAAGQLVALSAQSSVEHPFHFDRLGVSIPTSEDATLIMVQPVTQDLVDGLIERHSQEDAPCLPSEPVQVLAEN